MDFDRNNSLQYNRDSIKRGIQPAKQRNENRKKREEKKEDRKTQTTEKNVCLYSHKRIMTIRQTPFN